MEAAPPIGPYASAPALEAQHLERALAEDPRNVEKWTRYGEILLVLKRYAEALHAFQCAVQLNPGSAEAHFRLGVAFSNCGKHQEAFETYRHALSIKPDFPDAWNNLGSILDGAGRLEEAAGCFERAVEIAPHFTVAVNNLALARCKFGRWDEAAVLFRKVLARYPDDPGTFENLGFACYKLGSLDEAEVCFRKVLALRPDSSRTWNNLGNLLSEQSRWAEASPCFERAIELNPHSEQAFNNLGVLHLKLSRPREAEALFLRALALRPDFPDACNNLGLACLELGRLDEAEELFRKSIGMQPDLPKSHNHLGMVLRMRNRIEESIAACRQALALQPDFTEAFLNLSNSLRDAGRITEAMSAVSEGLRLKNDDPALRLNLAIHLMTLGQMDEGWREYEWRWQSPYYARVASAYTQPRWRGEAAAGKTLLLWSEQGFGDTIQFCRYAPFAAARGLRVVLMVQPPLVRLLRSLDGVEAIVGMGSSVPDHDFQCPLLSLPLVFGTALESIPADVPYLIAEEDAVREWKERLPAVPSGTIKAGLVWAGNAGGDDALAAMRDRRRSVAPQMLASLLDVEGVRFYSLQKDGPAAPGEFGLVDVMGYCRDFADTAAFIANLDLVISVDTAVVHLAGALGKPVWVLNRFDGCWRWLLDREDNPWYPGLRLFTQPRLGDWESVIARVRSELVTLAAGR